jgi:hypothetical protein
VFQFPLDVADGHAGRSRNRLGWSKFVRIVEELVDAGRLQFVEGGILLGAGGAYFIAQRGDGANGGAGQRERFSVGAEGEVGFEDAIIDGVLDAAGRGRSSNRSSVISSDQLEAVRILSRSIVMPPELKIRTALWCKP